MLLVVTMVLLVLLHLLLFFTNVVGPSNKEIESQKMPGNVTCCYHGSSSTVTLVFLLQTL